MYLTHMGQVIEHNGGIVEKFIDDAIMALWGAPLIHEDDADRALNTGLEMLVPTRGAQSATGLIRFQSIESSPLSVRRHETRALISHRSQPSASSLQHL